MKIFAERAGSAPYGKSEEDFLILAKYPGFHPLSFPMKQMTFADAEYAGKRKQARLKAQA
ncbi:hypothetical protein D3880_03970 [Pseudomonas cavernae]|uniref:Uncharacterized protein n=1 Tax=Pseudomonas cavernae TaxID=2320867 RepID=A0A385YYU8_9PSED|nr:hypothetical protein [Pseudomonas cavernae]AYC31601.1 hypothetical protein D3880_03970 [Pseudomonas cavernae]